MSKNELELKCNELLLKIHVITGWNIPTDEIMDLFIDQFKKKLLESYKTVNVDEMEYAFRTFGTSIKDWGKSMNLSLIDEVMEDYLAQRREVGKLEESYATKNLLAAPVKKLSEDDYTNWINEVKDLFNAGKYSPKLLPLLLYDKLNERKLITFDKIEIFEQAKMLRFHQLKKLAETDRANRNKHKENMDYILGGNEDKSHPEHRNIVMEAKRIALVKYFSSQKN
jgi:hypothetical protein